MKIIVPIVEFYEIFFKNSTSESIISSFNEKENQLFHEIQQGNIKTDKQAASLLYDGNPSGQAYCKFKQIFHDKLVRIVTTFQSTSLTKARTKSMELFNNYHAFMLMGQMNMTQASYKLGKRIILQADRLCFYDIAMTVSRSTMQYACTFLKDKNEGNKFLSKYEELKQRFEVETMAIEEYSQLMLLSKRKNINQKLADKAQEALVRLKPYIDHENMRFMQFYYQIRYVAHAAISENQGVIQNNLEAIEFFENFKIYNKSILDTLKVQLVISFISLGKYEQAAQYLETEDILITDYRWINKLQLKIRIYLHLQNYTKADEILNEVFNSVKFKEAEQVFLEQLWMYRYYCDIMLHLKDNVVLNTRKVRNNMTRLTADKEGQNVPFMIADIICEVLKKGTKVIYAKEDMLKNYMKRHLRNSNNERAIIFVKYLLSLPDYKYNKSRYAERVDSTKEGFREHPAELTTKPDNEIIPYEDILYEFLQRFPARKPSTKTSTQPAGESASDRASY